MVDLGVDVVGTSGEHNAAAAVFLHVGECLRARGADVGLGPALLFPREVGGMARFLFGNVPYFLTELDETVGGDLLVRESEEGMQVAHGASVTASTLFLIFSGYETTIGQLKWFCAPGTS